jgi:hypothetical protein
MVSVQTVAISFATAVLLLVAYRYIFNPQLLLRSGPGTTCPDQWTFLNGLCHPTYTTNCAAFDPETITSAAYGCNLSRTCGTSWPGKCP